MHLFAALCFILLSTASFAETLRESSLQVWKVGDRRWTVEDEYLYGKWVEANITEDFFIRYKIPVDCADVPYAIRWIYARLAGLPASATTKDGKRIGHWSREWGHLPTHPEWQKDKRFRSALIHMLFETTTKTLPLDTYPIRIAPDSITPGTVFFVTESHAGIVGRITLDGSHAHPLQTWEATLPTKIQKMGQKNFLSPRPESKSRSGLVKFLWTVVQNGRWDYLPAKEHPFYSEEQYRSDFYEGYSDFVEAVAKRIDPAVYDPWEKMEKVVETITCFLQERIPIVLKGFQQCRKGGCLEGSLLWEVYSTPGRDGMITLLMDHLRQIIEPHQLDREAVRQWMETIHFNISKDRFITFYHLYQNYLWLSPHPEDSIEARWGLKKCEMIQSQIRRARNSIAFIERTYRKKDPRYADFSIRQQQEILRRLVEEWDRSQCKESPSSKKKKGGQGDLEMGRWRDKKIRRSGN